jgi:hypothetical protein
MSLLLQRKHQIAGCWGYEILVLMQLLGDEAESHLHYWSFFPAGLCALSGCHPEQNPALAGQNIYKSREVQDTQIARLLGKVGA